MMTPMTNLENAPVGSLHVNVRASSQKFVSIQELERSLQIVKKNSILVYFASLRRIWESCTFAHVVEF